MPTTSLKLSDDLKARAAAAAKVQGLTPHAFMVEAIRTAATIAESRAQFVAQAEAARKAAVKSGLAFAADDVHAYIRNRIAGKAAKRPKAKSWQV